MRDWTELSLPEFNALCMESTDERSVTITNYGGHAFIDQIPKNTWALERLVDLRKGEVRWIG